MPPAQLQARTLIEFLNLESCILGTGLLNSFKVAVIIITLWGIGGVLYFKDLALILTLTLMGCEGFLFFKEDINKNNPCTTAFQCWMLAMNEGFRGD